ncbi:heterokaryon incompatibility protein-domain-containing protein [Xylariaceae sp. FL0255]|nr:heterokaryon incompatibility protein-domain-containing protein [Xylariaceae sp. FL0255]
MVDRGWISINVNMLSLGIFPPSPYEHVLVSQPKGFEAVRRLGPLISFDVVKEWLDFCRNHHTKDCVPREDSKTTSSMPSFKLIECATRKIVQLDQPYTALSYVWGDNTEASTPFLSEVGQTLPSELPNTIEDAIQATEKLGFGYLWVDRFCINQGNREELAEKIPRMDLIYNNAELTIVAAVGEDPEYGLPGIRPRRIDQPQGKIGKHYLISTMIDPVEFIKESKWMTRGWTYQEGLLSRRRLIFTYQQIYYECSGMYCCEALNFPLASLHTQNQQHFKFSFCCGNNTRLFPRRLGRTGWEVCERIKDYSLRSLKKDADILDGFMGILRSLEHGPRKLQHCLGVPVLPPPAMRFGKKEKDDENRDRAITEWSPTAGLCYGLCWGTVSPFTSHTGIRARREGFPSWSWTGCKTRIKWPYEERNMRHIPEIRVRLKRQNGPPILWENFDQVYNARDLLVANTLLIAGWVTDLEYTSGQDQRLYFKLRSVEGKELDWWFDLTVEPLADFPESWKALHFAHEFGGATHTIALLIHFTPSGSYKRLGINSTISIRKPGEYGRILFLKTPPNIEKSWQEFQLS